MLTAKQLGKQLVLILILGMVSITTFNIITNYYATKQNIETELLDKLHSIAKTTSLMIDGDAHDSLLERYPSKSDLNEAIQNENFKALNNILSQSKKVNNLNSDIYTLFLGSKSNKSTDLQNSRRPILFGVFSGNNQYFRTNYKIHPEELRQNFESGGVLPEYSTETGIWLSAFSPITNSRGETVAVIQVDQNVELFLNKVRNKSLQNALISFSIILVISLVMIFFVKKMVQRDKEKTQTIEKNSIKLKQQNIKIKDSINYAKKIQHAIISQEQNLKKYYPESFILFNPKDTVSGDFPWVYRSKESVYFSALDCTGHGVPGAMMSFVGYFLLEKIIQKNPEEFSCDLVKRLHQEVNKTLKQDLNSDHNHDGMDAAFCKIIQETNTLCFSGAHRPVYLVRNGELKIFKGARRGIGGTQYDNTTRTFNHHLVQLEEKDRLFIFTDGYADQFGGPDQKKLGTQKLKEILTKDLLLEDIYELLSTEFNSWKKDTEQTDDVLVMGVQV